MYVIESNGVLCIASQCFRNLPLLYLCQAHKFFEINAQIEFSNRCMQFADFLEFYPISIQTESITFLLTASNRDFLHSHRTASSCLWYLVHKCCCNSSMLCFWRGMLIKKVKKNMNIFSAPLSIYVEPSLSFFSLRCVNIPALSQTLRRFRTDLKKRMHGTEGKPWEPKARQRNGGGRDRGRIRSDSDWGGGGVGRGREKKAVARRVQPLPNLQCGSL